MHKITKITLITYLLEKEKEIKFKFISVFEKMNDE
jgi:hypothetical protein